MNGVMPLGVNFTDNSTGSVTNRLWDFGDGATSTATNPEHTFSAAGSYNVSLTVTGATGPNTLTRANYIVVSAPPANGLYVIVDTLSAWVGRRSKHSVKVASLSARRELGLSVDRRSPSLNP